jgi:creatinine amidohydrolase
MSKEGVLLEDLTWVEAEKVLTDETVIVIPLGAAAKEHGPHLRLNNDWVLAEYFKRRVMDIADVVITPTVPHHYYPVFTEYPGSISLRLETARDLIIDICRSLAAFGPKRFYVLNTGVSTLEALKPAAVALAEEKLLLRYTDITKVAEGAVKEVQEQDGGGHADEIETSMMLVIDPGRVDMTRAVRDFNPGPGLTRKPDTSKAYSPTGIHGNPTLAARAKGEPVIEAMVAGMLTDIEALKTSPPP